MNHLKMCSQSNIWTFKFIFNVFIFRFFNFDFHDPISDFCTDIQSNAFDKVVLQFCLNIGSIQHFLEALLGVQLFNADVYMLDAIPAEVDPWDVTWVALFSFFMSCLASLPPSWNASRIDPVEALRFE